MSRLSHSQSSRSRSVAEGGKEPDGRGARIAGADVVEITCLSEEYFDLLDDHPELGQFLALGDRVTFVFEGKAYGVIPEEEAGE